LTRMASDDHGGKVPRAIPKLPEIPEQERTPLVVILLETISLLKEMNQALKDEVARLKGLKGKPEIQPSKLEGDRDTRRQERNRRKASRKDQRRPGSQKRCKTKDLEIHDTVLIPPANIPEGSTFKGYQDYTIQDLVITVHNTRYRLERWQTPDGKHLVGKLPEELRGGHLGPTLVSYVLFQYYQNHVTQPLLLEELLELGLDISEGQVNRIITEGKERFHQEKDDILRVGLEVSGHINVDDTGARHQGKNGFCTHVGNELFAWFQSTESKSRVNFLKLLRAGEKDYVLSEIALTYMQEQRLPKAQLEALRNHLGQRFEGDGPWEAFLHSLDIVRPHHARYATEGALLGSILSHGLNPELVIISDDAGQFDVLLHGLCWIHAERLMVKLVGFNDNQRQAIKDVRSQIWQLYDELKAYREAPTEERKAELEKQFDEVFTQRTCFASLNRTLKQLHRNKRELLLVLRRPDIPLHNNLSENDIRDYVKWRKISGSTRSELGRRCRDTFVSLRKTCRKLGISFWSFLKDRLTGQERIPPLPEIIRARAQAGFT